MAFIRQWRVMAAQAGAQPSAGGPGLSWALVTCRSACEHGPEVWVGPGFGREQVRPQLVLGYPRLGGQSFGIKRESYRAVRDIVRYFAL